MITLLQSFRDGKDVFDVRERFVFRTQGSRDPARPGTVTVGQRIGELHDFLLWMVDHGVRRYVEVGVFRGGMLYIVDSWLRAHLSDVETHGVDLQDRMMCFEEYNAANQTCTFEVAECPPWRPDAPVDMIFVDTNARLKRLLRQYGLLRECTKYIAFHDVKDPRWGGVRFWDEFAENKLAEFHHRGKRNSPGIGVCLGSVE